MSRSEPDAVPPVNICLYCGASGGKDPAYLESARRFGRALGESGARLIYGGGGDGMMGAAAAACMEAGGEAIGVIPRTMVRREWAKKDLTQLLIVESMHTRKSVMASNAEGFAALPGGIGTLDEFFEILVWGDLSFHAKPVALVDVKGYWDPLLKFLDHAVEEGFVSPRARERFFLAPDPETAARELIRGAEALRASAPPRRREPRG
ncbi:TIGR00730 family Rossman fold protein [Neomegalonema sp.]|uniref:LOG family protein n=1 Tax=Neomegalonema sp. TaxID=2039713 RepID=UPI00261D00A6|nr:TIGR00730 family Rossman fold protein [Neomegalonema sp.]MDD2868803.1 TIGR00730 family Rossman fold protein [Neomegalonema sp.]